MCFISMYGVLNALSEYLCFCISRNITSYTFLLVFIIVESLQYILREKMSENSIGLKKFSGNFSSLYLYFLPDFSKHLLSNSFSLKFEGIKDCLWMCFFPNTIYAGKSAHNLRLCQSHVLNLKIFFVLL